MRFIVIFVFFFGFFANASLAQEDKEIDFVIEFFDKLQPISFAENKEYCGYFGIDENDNFIATKPTKGRIDSCFADDPPEDFNYFASYHTHGAFSFDADSELPSSTDLGADISEEVDGYISTPGGRIWFNDSVEEIAFLICGRNCTVSDDRYEADANPPVLNEYDMELLLKRDEMMD
ncbi:MAG: DUF4329 domain-containing protein [Devosiaceae bacterium]|nr:DUF4329 domain-containing protein [Devosiaceae bacterium]